ncbi:hypothetical protein, partial [Frankia sp. Cj3]|uniref:hypothetical protein n=1 Tax=Frankia sp. Cj3 TaxID=2880976 RepID=UPI001EF6BE2E
SVNSYAAIQRIPVAERACQSEYAASLCDRLSFAGKPFAYVREKFAQSTLCRRRHSPHFFDHSPCKSGLART